MNFKANLRLSEAESKILFLAVAIPLIVLMKIFQYLSRYYPFSLLFREKIFHYQNRHIKSLLTLIETSLNVIDKSFIVENAEKDRYFYTFYGRFKKRSGGKIQSMLKKHLAEKLETSSENIYINNQDNGSIRIRIPTTIARGTATD